MSDAQELTVEWATQFGTSATDRISAITVDDNGDIVVAGTTGGVLGSQSFGGSDGFVRKYDASGGLLWTHQFGGVGRDEAADVAVGSDGNIYVGGTIGLPGNSTTDAYLTKISPTGSEIWKRQFGGFDVDQAFGVAVDSQGNAYVTGRTDDVSAGDIFIRKYNPIGSLQWNRQIQATNSDQGLALTVDRFDNPILSGTTLGSLFAQSNGGFDAFFVKYDPLGNLVYGLQVGTSFNDAGTAITTDSQGNILMSGSWANGDPEAPRQQGFVLKWAVDGTEPWLNRSIGSDANDSVSDIAVDAEDDIFVTGITSGDVGVNYFGGTDVFLTKLHRDGQRLWSAQFGTPSNESGNGVAVVGRNTIYFGGSTGESFAGPTAGGTDAYLAKLNLRVPEPSSMPLLMISSLYAARIRQRSAAAGAANVA